MTQDDFLNAISENGADDDLQLVFSDWLEESGNSLRARLLRLQVELAQIPNEDPRYREVLDQERELWCEWMNAEIAARRKAGRFS
jgi:uncharacterized protein (TIGR02996 family)